MVRDGSWMRGANTLGMLTLEEQGANARSTRQCRPVTAPCTNSCEGSILHMSLTQPLVLPASATTTGLSFDVETRRDRAWRAITGETAAWWPQDMRVGGAASKLTFEARLGGRLFEEWDQGAGMTWYTVVAIEPLSSLDLAGHVTPRFGGPALSQLHVSLSDKGNGTRIAITDGVIGPTRLDMERRISEGRSLVVGTALKKYLDTL